MARQWRLSTGLASTVKSGILGLAGDEVVLMSGLQINTIIVKPDMYGYDETSRPKRDWSLHNVRDPVSPWWRGRPVL